MERQKPQNNMDMKILFKKENIDMKIIARETAMDIKKVLVLSIKTSCRGVHDHPALAGFMFILFLMYHFHPFLFAWLINSSPVIICTALLLGTLLSYGDLHLPEIEEAEEKATYDVSALRACSIPDDLVFKRGGKVSMENREDARAGSSLRRAVEDYDDAVSRSGDVGDAESLQECRRTTEAEQSEHQEAQHFSEVHDELEKAEFLTAYDEGEKRENIASGASSEAERVVPGEEDQDEDASENREFSAGLSTDKSVANQGIKMESDEPKKYSSIYSLLRSSKKPVDGPGDYSDYNSDDAESSSPDASMADILPMLAELHPLLDSEHSQPVHINIDDSDDTSELSPQDERSDYSSEEVADGQEGEQAKDNKTKGLVAWTAYDLKNVMDVGTSELERNRRLENLIAKRMARKKAEAGNLMDRDQNRSLSMMNRYSHLRISPVWPRRINPFDHVDVTEEMKDLHPRPGSAPPVFFNGRNPFEFPSHHGIYSGNFMNDRHSHQKLMTGDQGDTSSPAFTRFASKESFFGDDNGKNLVANFKPYFVPEKIFSDEASCSQFQRQFSEISVSRLSPVPESEAISSAPDYPKGLVGNEESEIISPAKQNGIATTVYDQDEREINLRSCYESNHNSLSTKEVQAIDAPSVLETEEFGCEELPISYASQSEVVEDKCNDDIADEKLINLDDTILKRTNNNGLFFSTPEEMDRPQQKKISSSETNNDTDDAGFMHLDDMIQKRIDGNRYLFTGSNSKEPSSESSRRIENMDKSQLEESTSSKGRHDNADGIFIGLDDTILKRMNSNRHLFTEPNPNDSLTNRKAEKMDEMQHTDIRYSSLTPIETFTSDGDLLEPLLSPDSVTEQQQIFKTYSSQRSTNLQKDVDFALQNESMTGGSDGEENVRSTETDKAKFNGSDMTRSHLSDGNEEVEASNFSIDELVTPDYLQFGVSQNVSCPLNEPPVQPSDSKTESTVVVLPSKTVRTIADMGRDINSDINLTDDGSVSRGEYCGSNMEDSNDLMEEYDKTDTVKSEFKEVDESLLTELDAVGDYSVDRLTLDGNQRDQRLHLYSHSDGGVPGSAVFARKEAPFMDTLPEMPLDVGTEGPRVTDSKRDSKFSTKDLDTSGDISKLHIAEASHIEKADCEVDVPVLESASEKSLFTQMELPFENTDATFLEESVIRKENFLDSGSSSKQPKEGKVLEVALQGVHADMQEVEARSVEDLHMLQQPREHGAESPAGNTVDKFFSLEQDNAHSGLEIASKPREVEARPIEDTELGMDCLVGAIEHPHKQFCKGNVQSMEPENTQKHGVHSGEKGSKTQRYMCMSSNELPQTEVHQREDIELTLKQRAVNKENLPNQTEEGRHLDEAENYPMLHEIEAQSIDEINSALKKFSRDVNNEPDIDSSPEETHEMEAPSFEDAQVVPKGSEGTSDDLRKLIEFKEFSSKPELTPKDIDSVMKIHPNLYELDLHEDEKHSPNKHNLPDQTEEGTHSEKADIHPTLHEIEAKSIDDINSALKQISEEINNDPDIDTSSTDTHETEAHPFEDMHVIPNHSVCASDDQETLVESKEVSSEPELTENDIDSDFRIQPDIFELDFHEDKPQSLENKCTALNQDSEESKGAPENSTESENLISTIEVRASAETFSEMHEVEARSVEDILALRQLSMKIIEKSEEEEKFEDASSDIESAETEMEPDLEIRSDLHVVEAESAEDINLAMKKYSGRTYRIHDKKDEDKDVTSNDGITYGDNESHMETLPAGTVSGEKTIS